MSLGASNGSVIYGRPLDLTIQARLDGPVDESSNCFSAEVFQGDARFDSGRVRVDVKAAANPLEALIRIRSTATITEPWAKVILRSNCGTTISRQYDFLTDFVSDLPANLPNARLPVVASTAREAQVPASALPALASLTTPAAGTALTAKSLASKQKLAKSKLAKEAKPATTSANTSSNESTTVASNTPAVRPSKLKSSNKLVAKANPAAEGKSRLKMETFDLADERQVMLKMSTALLAPVASDTPANAQALAQAAAVWRALNAKPEDVAADAQKLQATAAELQSVKSAALKEQASLQERLRVAEEKKFANPLVYGLLTLLALTLAGLTWMWLRHRKNAQAEYAWLGDTTVPLDDQRTPDGEVTEPSFVHTVNTAPVQPVHHEEVNLARVPVPVLVAQEEVLATSTEALPEAVLLPEASAEISSEALSAPMLFTKPAPKVDIHIDNNPLWPAGAVSATHTDTPESLVIPQTEAFLLPITQPEPESQPTTPYPPLDKQEAPIDLQLQQQKIVAPPETLNIDLDFSKIAPPTSRKSVSIKNKNIDNHIEFYSDAEHAKAGQAENLAEQSGERKPKNPPPLPKPVRKPQKSAAPDAAEQKSNLIDFESFAAPPAPPRPSRFTG